MNSNNIHQKCVTQISLLEGMEDEEKGSQEEDRKGAEMWLLLDSLRVIICDKRGIEFQAYSPNMFTLPCLR